MSKTKTYTVAELLALNTDKLNELAAMLVMGWTLGEDRYPEELAPHRKSKTIPVWLRHGDFTGMAPESLSGYVYKYTPTTNRNQSGELLREMATKGVLFDAAFGHFAPDERHPHVEVYLPVYTNDYTSRNQWLLHIPDNDARAETIAAVAAWLALNGRLTQ